MHGHQQLWVLRELTCTPFAGYLIGSVSTSHKITGAKNFDYYLQANPHHVHTERTTTVLAKSRKGAELKIHTTKYLFAYFCEKISRKLYRIIRH